MPIILVCVSMQDSPTLYNVDLLQRDDLVESFDEHDIVVIGRVSVIVRSV
jgi:hypothetical protein